MKKTEQVENMLAGLQLKNTVCISLLYFEISQRKDKNENHLGQGNDDPVHQKTTCTWMLRPGRNMEEP
jgi:hypothetical protein